MKTPRCTCPDCRIDWTKVLTAAAAVAACLAVWACAAAAARPVVASIVGWLS